MSESSTFSHKNLCPPLALWGEPMKKKKKIFAHQMKEIGNEGTEDDHMSKREVGISWDIWFENKESRIA